MPDKALTGQAPRGQFDMLGNPIYRALGPSPLPATFLWSIIYATVPYAHWHQFSVEARRNVVSRLSPVICHADSAQSFTERQGTE